MKRQIRLHPIISHDIMSNSFYVQSTQERLQFIEKKMNCLYLNYMPYMNTSMKRRREVLLHTFSTIPYASITDIVK